jgi:23S rRNA (uracil1939-C5)-methyltransferase
MELVLEITDLSRSGAGLGRDASGRVIFVPFTAPGDLVRVEIVAEDKRYAEGKMLELLRASAERIEPKCPVFTRCGGCEWQHLPYERQWRAKKEGLLHALSRVGVPTEGICWEDFPADRIWEYRNRIQLRGFANEIGFFSRQSRSLVPIEKCWIARPEINDRLTDAREAGRSRPREYKVELEVLASGEVAEAWNSGHSARGFRQVHDEQNTKLQKWVAENSGEEGVLLDLYGGSGNLSLGISERFSEVHCVDIGSPSKNPPGTPANFHFHRAPVLQWLERERQRLQDGPPIHLVLDPPREGLGTELGAIVEILVSLPIQSTLLIGCEPDPWGRALHRLLKRGWALDSLGALDFFPQTHHLESLAVLHRNT